MISFMITFWKIEFWKVSVNLCCLENYKRIKLLKFLKRKCFINGEYYKAFFTIIVLLVFYNFLLGNLLCFFNIFNLKFF